MKKIFLLAMMCLMVMTMQAQDYVDLGLPSGTKWKTTNEKNAADAKYDFFTYDKAVSQFGNSLPTKAQLEELKSKCQWSWTGNGYKVTGPNGNSISLPAEGYRSCHGTLSYVGDVGHYWASTPSGSDYSACYLDFNYSGNVDVIYSGNLCYGCSVRLVQLDTNSSSNGGSSGTNQPMEKVQNEYIDLGLPSGTIWKSQNENGFYTYNEAVSHFGANLPTKAQWDELVTKCQWSWKDSSCRVTGPNGNSITLPAAGYRRCDGVIDYVSSDGIYWSSTPDGSGYAWYLHFLSVTMGVGSSHMCDGRSVRLVQPGSNSSSNGEYTDLGLPSGTKWKSQVEKGFYTYNEAVSQFGNSLPTKTQWEELKSECQWSWTGSFYMATGPNGNSISLPATGYRFCDGSVNNVGSDGYYWSSTPYGSKAAWCFGFGPSHLGMADGNLCLGLPVLLVQD